MESHLEIFSLPQAIENSRQFSLPRKDILQKTVVGYSREVALMYGKVGRVLLFFRGVWNP